MSLCHLERLSSDSSLTPAQHQDSVSSTRKGCDPDHPPQHFLHSLPLPPPALLRGGNSPGPSPADELLCLARLEHQAQSPALPRNPGNLKSIFSTDPCTTALTLSCVAHAPFPWQPASFIQLHYFCCLRLPESLVPKPWLRATLC